MSQDLNRTLSATVTAFDRRESTKRGYNRYALGQYLLRVDEVCADVQAGAPVREALVAAFTGRLLDTCLKAVGEPKSTDAENRGGMRGYTPASQR